jgi:hypothetical protein
VEEALLTAGCPAVEHAPHATPLALTLAWHRLHDVVATIQRGPHHGVAHNPREEMVNNNHAPHLCRFQEE